ncbi:MAG: TetR/AcrR family transcriptional regulator [Clostridia bacterium]|nr:TetR/AcrR family transcriptional regulator [Clostridia bacterium]
MVKDAVSDKKTQIITETWEYLLKKGLADASIGELCRETNCAQSSLYYWFENKDDIWINAGKYGLSKVVDALFAFTVKNIGDSRRFFDTLLDEVDKYKYELRLAVQITTSPVFGERMRAKSKEFNVLYENYGEKIINLCGCSVEDVEIFIYSVIAFVIDYAIWDDREETQMLLENLYQRVEKKFQKNN